MLRICLNDPLNSILSDFSLALAPVMSSCSGPSIGSCWRAAHGRPIPLLESVGAVFENRFPKSHLHINGTTCRTCSLAGTFFLEELLPTLAPAPCLLKPIEWPHHRPGSNRQRRYTRFSAIRNTVLPVADESFAGTVQQHFLWHAANTVSTLLPDQVKRQHDRNDGQCDVAFSPREFGRLLTEQSSASRRLRSERLRRFVRRSDTRLAVNWSDDSNDEASTFVVVFSSYGRMQDSRHAG